MQAFDDATTQTGVGSGSGLALASVIFQTPTRLWNGHRRETPSARIDSDMPKKRDIVQVRNPRSDRFVKIDRAAGTIVDYKKSSGPYKNVPIARKSSKRK